MHSSCPAKIMLAGEYAVVEGGPALLLAVDRRAVARLHDREQKLSLFLQAAQRVLAEELGPESAEARACLRVRVDTSGFQEGGKKLGLGSSAAATVAAIGLALGVGGESLDGALVERLATRAHGEAQAKLGARGSGADIACISRGGCLRFSPAGPSESVQLPEGLELVFPWTGQAAHTAPLVAAVRSFGERAPAAYAELCARLSEGAESLASASSAAHFVGALGEAGQAARALGEAAEVDIWLPIHSSLAELAQAHEGSLKPSGAGGGDLAVAAFSSKERAQHYREALAKRGIICPALAVDIQGVHLRA